MYDVHFVFLKKDEVVMDISKHANPFRMNRAVLCLALTTLAVGSSNASEAAQRVRQFDYATPELRTISEPAVGKEAEVEVGQTMVAAYVVRRLPAIQLKTVVSGKAFGFRVEVSPGLLPLQGHNSDGDFYQQPSGIGLTTFGVAQSDGRGGVFVPRQHEAKPELYWSFSTGAGNMAETQDLVFEPAFSDEADGSSVQRQLVYSGISKGVISILYREFVDDVARPAFSQALTYDLADGDEIGYRGARFKVIKANNTGIRYLVLKPLTGN
jgi:hypothetical protein